MKHLKPFYIHFRIFIDAATLKEVSIEYPSVDLPEFPHLYRCGHIEGRLWTSHC